MKLSFGILHLFLKQTLLSLGDSPALVDDPLVDINNGVSTRDLSAILVSYHKSVKDAM